MHSLPCVIRVTDDDSMTAIDSVLLSVDLEWAEVPLPSGVGSILNGGKFGDKLVVYNLDNIWTSVDGQNWQGPFPTPWKNAPGTNYNKWVSQLVTFNNTMWIMYKNLELDSEKLWFYNDLIIWDSLSLSLPHSKYCRFLFDSFNNKLIVGSDSILFSSINGRTWDTIGEKSKNDNVVPSGFGYSTEFNSKLFLSCTETSIGKDFMISIWQTQDFKDIALIKSIPRINTAGSSAPYPITKYMNNLCLFINPGSVFKNAGKMLTTVDGVNWKVFSNLPNTPNNYLAAIEFQGKLFLMSSEKMWKSK